MTQREPRVTVDCVVFGFDAGELKVLLVRREAVDVPGYVEPFPRFWAIPGAYWRGGEESLEDTARRCLRDEAGIEGVFLEQLYTFGDPGRDPRGPTVTVAYYALVAMEGHDVRPRLHAEEARWVAVSGVEALRAAPERVLAFDHDRILATALERLRAKVRYQPIGFELLPEKFTLNQIHHLYEAVLGRPVDNRNFRRRFLLSGLLVELGEVQEDSPARRKPRLFRFDRDRYDALTREGFHFDVWGVGAGG